MGQHNRVAIVIDSAASLPPELAGGVEGELYIAPMQLMIDGKTYLDGRDMAPTAFYRTMRQISKPPTTSAPSPASFLESFELAGQTATEVLCITVSPKFSSSFDAAGAAVKEAKEALPGVKISVLDSESAAGGQGLVVAQAHRAARGGNVSLAEVAGSARAVVPRVTLLAFLDTLYYVWRSGRVPRLAHLGASLLGIKPLLEMSRGDVQPVARPRSRPRASQRMVDMMRARVGDGPVHATVMHGDAPDEAERLRRQVESDFQCKELYVSEFSPVMGAHTGPGLLGIAFWPEPQRQQTGQ